MGAVVVDTSVLLGVLDPDDVHHAAATREFRKLRVDGAYLILPASAFAEALVAASRIGPAAVKTTEAFVDTLIDAVQDIDRPVARAAASYRARHPALRLPDAFVLAVGDTTEADAILTADKRWRKVDKRVRVLAPT
jgi:predicted nucleic acid-binding protein